MMTRNIKVLTIAVLVSSFALIKGQNASSVACPDGSQSTGKISVTGSGSVTNQPDLATVRHQYRLNLPTRLFDFLRARL